MLWVMIDAAADGAPETQLIRAWIAEIADAISVAVAAKDSDRVDALADRFGRMVAALC